jgi:4-hydroxythreonine-4-phosphate dehydrogenase
MDMQIMEICTPLVYGMSKAVSYHRKSIKSGSDFSFHLIRQPEQVSIKRPNLISINDKEVKINLGAATSIAGEMALASLEIACDHLLEGKIDVLVTAPVNKHTMGGKTNPFSGHTEYLAAKTRASDCLMLMITENLKIGILTTHCALSDVPRLISKELIRQKLSVLNTSLKEDFLYTKPKIAVLSLNPHAGENGMFGKEEEKLIIPALQEAFAEGIYVFGPYPADGFFASGQYTQFDAVLAMYHDQAMLPFKILSCSQGVNYTAGLPCIRTSPAHGTAYDIAGKDIASPDAFRQAIYWACDIFRNRKESRSKAN